jgi:predicted SAM-dependent methyltransferase
MKLLNCGCGNKYHPDWINIDNTPVNKMILKHNLRKGIPFEKNYFDVVYHSHVLEHFSRIDGKKFMDECYRVLKPGGIIRIVVPDLENITRTYLEILEECKIRKELSFRKHEWIIMELFDQISRNYTGGEMGKFLERSTDIKPFIEERIGTFNVLAEKTTNKNSLIKKIEKKISTLTKRIFKYYSIGRFRFGGEIHYFMYDSYSLSLLLKQVGFQKITFQYAEVSMIPNWKLYSFDTYNGSIPKVNLIIEAIK